jgi:hypothetical protein
VEYINTFLKLKAEASGYTAWFKTEGVRLDRAAIQPNAAKRGIANLCLISMWSKFNRTKQSKKPRFLTRRNCIASLPRRE